MGDELTAELRFVEARDGTRLAVHDSGDGPPLLCVPGGPGRASAYLEDLAGLDGSHRLLRLDMRGTGRSELPEDRESLAFPRLADDVEDVRDALGLDRVTLLGHSAGCLVSLVYAARHPDQLERLVLVTPSGRSFMSPEDDDVPAIKASRADEDWYAEVAAAEREIEQLPPNRRARMDRALRPFFYGRWDERCQAHAATADTQVSMRAAAGFVPDPLPDVAPLVESLGAVDVPVLVVVGGRDGVTGVRAGHVVADLFRDSSVVEVPAAGHFPWVDEPEQFRAVVAGFLAG